MENKGIKIALFFGGKVTKHLGMIKKAARKLGIKLDLISYNRVYFETENGKVGIRPAFAPSTALRATAGKSNKGNLEGYDVLFFRTTGKHWEEVNLIVESLKSESQKKKPIIVDPMVEKGRPSDACKAYQMMELKKAGIKVPKTVYGSLWWLYELMNSSQKAFCGASARGGLPPQRRGSQCHKKLLTAKGLNFPVILKGSGGDPPSPRLWRASRGMAEWSFPVIIKGSGGDRGTRVYKAENLEELEKLVRRLRKTETEEGKRYMLQEYIENEGDYRVLVLGKKVLGVMKRTRQKKGEFRNNFSLGGKVEVVDLPEEVRKMAVKAAEVCGLWVAGVDIIEKDNCGLSNNPEDYVVLEVNKGPQFKGFMQATGIDVPREIIKFLVNLKVDKDSH